MHSFQRRHLLISSVLAFSIAAPAASSAQGKKLRSIEAYPDVIAERLKQRAIALKSLPENYKGINIKFVIVKDARRWKPGAKITVAFEKDAGDANLRRSVENAANVWAQYANIKFDFHDTNTKKYREFSAEDKEYKASIRVSFRTGNGWEGYWSAVGNDSINSDYSKPWEPSMNLGGIEREDKDSLVGIVLHEFGHALGAEHEHQHPGSGCADGWRWDDDAGYVSTTDGEGYLVNDRYGRRPGIYTFMSGATDYWPRSKVDGNMRALTDQSAYDIGPFDKLSIMKYYFPSDFYLLGDKSPCFTGEAAKQLSEGDKTFIAVIYRRGEALETAASKRQSLSDILREFSGSAPPNTAVSDAIRFLER